ncbi:MAG: hypothetical protein HOD43_04200 [Candidatus Marinimicrobia bacterium]|jgi:hypothetical protein|nr:hypothetical protein [Candidatus Neomarinimicrobiota bacterium]MBT3629960.1 hypothetical protein [Candidatus Neomarinimicrobiota bacterium]MBT3825551.1 hypothetical protein [Candidatus Neomarinimicrobiota bacterium]MBT4130977.1 hypothetical protein [Candidatus Neomarinimicrobiota bacterium]MBT4294986.1 hypothetical protein [Candidatus Neomarinimicrobiota bacterium]
MAWGNPKPDTTKFDRSVHGRPFNLDEIIGTPVIDDILSPQNGAPKWVGAGELTSDTLYYGIGKSSESQEEADNDARLHFAQYVEVSVHSIATQQIAENKDRLEENYNYESLVSTNMNLRSVRISERYVSGDSTFHSLISYGKSSYHRLVTQEIQISLEANIRKQELAHQATEALRADSLRHKITMDSLSLGRKQAVIDSLDHILKMDEARLRQEQDRVDLIKSQHAAFLKIKPRYQLIDIPTASTPRTWVYGSGRWDPNTENIRQLKTGVSIWFISAETNVWATESAINQADLMLKLQLLPERGEVYKVSLAFGWTNYLEAFSQTNRERLREENGYRRFISILDDELKDPYAQKSSFFVTGTVGIPQIDNHLSVYVDKRRVSLANIWYPFPRNMGDAISIINQFDYISSGPYRNRFDDQLQWQLGLRLIAVADRFATMISYEDHEVWMLNFEFQY